MVSYAFLLRAPRPVLMVRALAAAGVTSYMLLIVHDALRPPVDAMLASGAGRGWGMAAIFCVQLPLAFVLAPRLHRWLERVTERPRAADPPQAAPATGPIADMAA
jgi:hypothetical protein